MDFFYKCKTCKLLKKYMFKILKKKKGEKMPVSSCVCVWTAREGNFPHTTNLLSLAELGVTCVDVKKRKKWLKKNPTA